MRSGCTSTREKEVCMRHFKRDMSMMLTGMALGAVLTGGAVAAGVMAEPAWSPIYVDGQQVHMTAYNIAGNNYVKLRDIGQAVGFNVFFRNGVQVDSTSPYTGEAPVQSPAQKAISVSSYKGNALHTGDRSGLMIYPSGTAYTVSSSNPAVLTVEKVSENWVAVAKSAGTAMVTVKNGSGETGQLTLTISENTADSKTNSGIDLTANMEIREEMIRLINQVRREHGVAELPSSEDVMDAAQAISAQCRTDHGSYEWEALLAHGWPHGGSNNKTSFNQLSDDNIAQHAVENWVSSPPHLQNLLRSDVTCLGTGVTIKGEMVYCHMFVGNPDGIGPL